MLRGRAMLMAAVGARGGVAVVTSVDATGVPPGGTGVDPVGRTGTGTGTGAGVETVTVGAVVNGVTADQGASDAAAAASGVRGRTTRVVAATRGRAGRAVGARSEAEGATNGVSVGRRVGPMSVAVAMTGPGGTSVGEGTGPDVTSVVGGMTAVAGMTALDVMSVGEGTGSRGRRTGAGTLRVVAPTGHEAGRSGPTARTHRASRSRRFPSTSRPASWIVPRAVSCSR